MLSVARAGATSCRATASMAASRRGTSGPIRPSSALLRSTAVHVVGDRRVALQRRRPRPRVLTLPAGRTVKRRRVRSTRLTATARVAPSCRSTTGPRAKSTGFPSCTAASAARQQTHRRRCPCDRRRRRRRRRPRRHRRHRNFASMTAHSCRTVSARTVGLTLRGRRAVMARTARTAVRGSSTHLPLLRHPNRLRRPRRAARTGRSRRLHARRPRPVRRRQIRAVRRARRPRRCRTLPRSLRGHPWPRGPSPARAKAPCLAATRAALAPPNSPVGAAVLSSWRQSRRRRRPCRPRHPTARHPYRRSARASAWRR